MKELDALAEKVKSQLNLDYDEKSVKFIEDFIERQWNNFNSEQRNGIVNSIGLFVGQCIIKNYGGHWQVDKDTQAVCVAIDDKNKIFPFSAIIALSTAFFLSKPTECNPDSLLRFITCL